MERHSPHSPNLEPGSPLEEVAAALPRYGFYAALRLIEARTRDRPRLGKSRSPTEDVVRLGQPPHLGFPAPELAGILRRSGQPPWLLVNGFGLFGPNGPLPLHLTEYAGERIEHARDDGFAAFCDLFHHRLICLFYRAWADKEPTVNHDHPGKDRFAFYLAALAGYALPAQSGFDAMPDSAKRHFTGHLARRPANRSGLTAILAALFGVRVEIEEFVEDWPEIPEPDRCRLGAAVLGITAIGSRSRNPAGMFRIRLGPLSRRIYESFLPHGDALVALRAVVRNWVGWGLGWELQLILRGEDIPEPRLGGESRLGWCLWLGRGPSPQPADDLHLRPRPP